MFTQRRHKCAALFRNTKKNYYDNLDKKGNFGRLQNLTFLIMKIKTFNEHGELIKSEAKSADALNNSFSNRVKKLKNS